LRARLRPIRRLLTRLIRLPRRLVHAFRYRFFAPERSAAIFNLDLHASIIADTRVAAADRNLSLTEWTLTSPPWFAGRGPVPTAVVNEFTWRGFDPGMVKRFQRIYGRYLRQFDGFIATYPPCFSALFREFAGPTLAICATRYEYPMTHDAARWRWLDEMLREGVESGSLTLTANNRADADYVANYTGLNPAYVPSACTYTGATYTGRRSVSLIATLHEELGRAISRELSADALPFREALGSGYEWESFYDCRALILLPYNVSTMTLFEAYSACMPIYVPDRDFLKQLAAEHPDDVLCHLSFSQVTGMPAVPPPEGALDLNDVRDPSVIDWYLERADFYSPEWMPEVRTFESWSHLDHLLATDDPHAISERMAAVRPDRLARISARWDALGWFPRVARGVEDQPLDDPRGLSRPPSAAA
jgi:hypothetical protein